MNKIFGFKKSVKKLGPTETEFLPSVLEVIETPPSPLGRAMIWTMITLVVIGLLWSIIGYTDEVAVAPGKLIPSGHVKVIQAEDKGIVKRIPIRDGQRVRQGDVLLELDPVFTAADLARLNKELAFFTLDMERLLAEREGRLFQPADSKAADVKDLEYQTRLYQSRSAEFNARKASLEQSIAQNESALRMAFADRERYQAMYFIAREKETKLQQLVDQDAVAYFVLLDHRSRRMELEQNMTSAASNIEKCQSAIDQSRENLRSYYAERDREIDAKLLDDRKQAQSLTEELKKAAEKNRLSQIIAPIDGKVHQLAVHTLGAVVTTAQQLLVLVPDDVAVEAETWVANKDIGFVHIGQPAEVKVETFSFQKFGTVPAEVAEISPDAVEDKEKGLVYRAVLRLKQSDIEVNGKPVALSPGMSVSAEIKTRQKHIIEYFLDPFKKYRSEGLRER